MVTITKIPYEQFLQDLDTRIQQALTTPAVPVEAAAETGEELLSTRRAARLLGVSKATVSRWRARGLIRSHRIGRHVLYKRSELLGDVENASAGGEGATHE